MTRLTHGRLVEVLRYDPQTGLFYWRHRPGSRPQYNGRFAGKEAGYVNSEGNGYVLICVDGAMHAAHRLAWFYVTGKWPEDQIDHKDRDRTNNKWANLREANPESNGANTRLSSNNRSGATGVWRHPSGRWHAFLNVKRKRIHIGVFSDFETAVAARRSKEQEVWGQFAPEHA